ncbi:hypothetical protein C2E21_1211 [Chlorella sorokiniana]|uniref:Uncharacterized protein n=1 Tax=Chlorella sorokiniana TaxID=3076 RepID=A0A2P6U204_CHLSO|nr:hypothetical protein C2E21_1211 [Chlorella sorokiniana]|eukprot:PRW60330.1 hypothetical protein C2E21_1211 [Chlorella sorokiniana]
MGDVATLLDQLLAGFQRLELTASPAERTHGLSLELQKAAEEVDGAHYAADGGLEERMVALAQALLDWAPMAVHALPTLLVGWEARPPWLLQFAAGCTSLAALSDLVWHLEVQRRTAFHIAAACQLVFGLGRRAMGLHAVAAVTRALRRRGQGNAKAAFARSTARPAVLLPWLMVVLRAVEPGGPYVGPQVADQLSTAISRTISPLFIDGDFSEHKAVVAADPALQDAIAGALLTSCLPHMAAAFAEAAPAGLPPPLLRCCGRPLSAAADSAAASSALAERLRQAAQQLQGWAPQGLSNPQQTEQQLQQAAALMQQYYALPAVAAERQLAVAQAAAGRSCAYLRCANLGGEGRPATGQGLGSMRCG